MSPIKMLLNSKKFLLAIFSFFQFADTKALPDIKKKIAFTV